MYEREKHTDESWKLSQILIKYFYQFEICILTKKLINSSKYKNIVTQKKKMKKEKEGIYWKDSKKNV